MLRWPTDAGRALPMRGACMDSSFASVAAAGDSDHAPSSRWSRLSTSSARLRALEARLAALERRAPALARGARPLHTPPPFTADASRRAAPAQPTAAPPEPAAVSQPTRRRRPTRAHRPPPPPSAAAEPPPPEPAISFEERFGTQLGRSGSAASRSRSAAFFLVQLFDRGRPDRPRRAHLPRRRCSRPR